MNSTAQRIKEAMSLRGLKQVDLVEKTGINKGALSSYISGRYIPKQNNLCILAKALNVNEYWLSGYNVPMDSAYIVKESNIQNILFEITPRSLKNSPRIFEALVNFVCNELTEEVNDIDLHDFFVNSTSIEEKAEMLNGLIDYVIYSPDNDKITINLLSSEADTKKRKLSMSTSSAETRKLIEYFSILNKDGEKKVMEFVADLSLLDKYIN